VLSNGRIKPSWDFAEGVTISDSSGSFSVCVENLIAGVHSVQGVDTIGTIEQAPAQQHPLGDAASNIWFTDPPYYNAIPYADLSDMFFVWYKRIFQDSRAPKDRWDTSNTLTPKQFEVVQDESRIVDGKPKDKDFFKTEMAKAFAEGRRVLRDGGRGCVVFAHKSTEGWEALLEGMISGGWVITGSWPIATEQAHRLRARESAALGTSVHLVCRPRDETPTVGDWAHVLRTLPVRVGEWMERLSNEGVRGADLVFACIGPALEIYSQYTRVETPDGRPIELPEYLEKIWETVGRKALERVLGSADTRVRKVGAPSLEEDARLTALFLWTLQSTEAEDATEPEEDDAEAEESDEESEGLSKGGYTLIHDVVRRFAQPLGIHLDSWEGRVIEIDKGVVRLLCLAERAERLFGTEGADAVADQIENSAASSGQLTLFPEDTRPLPPPR
jgi:putative DNA methylase